MQSHWDGGEGDSRYEALFDAAPVAILLLGRDCEVVEVSDRAAALLGVDGRELVGSSFGTSPLDVVDGDGEQVPLADLLYDRVVHDRQEVYDQEVGVSLPSGERLWVNLNAAPVLDNGVVENVVVVLEDVTIRREYEGMLEAQNERLESFASIVSHDLRNPLSVADGFLDLYRDTGDDEYLGGVERALNRAGTLLDDLHDLARRGQSVSNREQVALAEVAREAWETTASEDATLSVHTDIRVDADASRLRELLENLFSNAVTHAGPSARVRVGATPDGFFVEDDGPGVPPDRREKVFEHGHTTSDDRTGYGLAIVETIAEAHGWSVRCVEGATGGARFEVTGVGTAGD